MYIGGWVLVSRLGGVHLVRQSQKEEQQIHK